MSTNNDKAPGVDAIAASHAERDAATARAEAAEKRADKMHEAWIAQSPMGWCQFCVAVLFATPGQTRESFAAIWRIHDETCTGSPRVDVRARAEAADRELAAARMEIGSLTGTLRSIGAYLGVLDGAPIDEIEPVAKLIAYDRKDPQAAIDKERALAKQAEAMSARFHARAERLAEVLGDVEWSGCSHQDYSYVRCCPSCGESKHAKTCEFLAALADAPPAIVLTFDEAEDAADALYDHVAGDCERDGTCAESWAAFKALEAALRAKIAAAKAGIA